MRGPILCTICHQPQRLCTHKHGAVYAIIDLQTQERGTFRAARDVAMFMWGRDFKKYRIFKAGQVVQWFDGDLHAFEQALEAV